MSKISLAPNISGTGTLTISAPNTNTDRAIALPDAAGTVFVSGQALSATTGSFSGTVSGGSTIGVGGATPSASGAGITFPATQSASTDANTLDDYEEGTWTPTFSSPVNLTGTPSTSGATYTKVGRLVYLTSRITGYSVTSSNTATYPVVNVPFPMISNTSPVTGSVFAVVGGVFVSGALCDNSSGNTSEIALVMPAVSITTSGSITIDFSIVYQTT